jgi:hypothetical protein
MLSVNVGSSIRRCATITAIQTVYTCERVRTDSAFSNAVEATAQSGYFPQIRLPELSVSLKVFNEANHNVIFGISPSTTESAAEQCWNSEN